MIFETIAIVRSYFKVARQGRAFPGKSPLIRHRITWPFGVTEALFFP